jgi:hypothetical protein
MWRFITGCRDMHVQEWTVRQESDKMWRFSDDKTRGATVYVNHITLKFGPEFWVNYTTKNIF